MRSADALTRPAQWPRSRYRLVERVSVAGFFLVGALVGLAGLAGGITGESTVLRYGLGGGAALVLVAAMGAEARSARHLACDIRTVDDDGTPATELRQSRRLWWLILVTLAVWAVVCLGAAAEIWLRAPGSGVVRGTLTFGVFGACFAGYVGAAVVGRTRPGYVRLSANGIEQRGWSFESTLPWDAVTGAAPAYDDHRMVLVFGARRAWWTRRYTTRLWRLDRLPPVTMIELDCRRFALDDTLLAHLVCFYANHPAARVELGTETAVLRARYRDYPPPPTR